MEHIYRCNKQEPLPLSSRSDRVCAPDLDLAGSDSNSLLNLGWNRGMHRKSNLQPQSTKHFITVLIAECVKQSLSFGGAIFQITCLGQKTQERHRCDGTRAGSEPANLALSLGASTPVFPPVRAHYRRLGKIWLLTHPSLATADNASDISGTQFKSLPQDTLFMVLADAMILADWMEWLAPLRCFCLTKKLTPSWILSDRPVHGGRKWLRSKMDVAVFQLLVSSLSRDAAHLIYRLFFIAFRVLLISSNNSYSIWHLCSDDLNTFITRTKI